MQAGTSNHPSLLSWEFCTLRRFVKKLAISSDTSRNLTSAASYWHKTITNYSCSKVAFGIIKLYSLTTILWQNALLF